MEVGIYQAFFGNPAQIGHFDLAAKHFPSPEACIVNDEVKNVRGTFWGFGFCVGFPIWDRVSNVESDCPVEFLSHESLESP